MESDALSTLPLDRTPGAAPLPAQIAAGVRGLIASGALASGDVLASSRSAAETLGVARGTVSAAYEQLVAEGYLVTRDRSGVRVAPNLSAAPPRAALPARRRPAPPPPPLDFGSGHETSRPLDDALWRSSLRAAVSPGGPALAEAIAQHLRLMRAMAVDPASVIVTAGARSGLALLLGAVARRTGSRPRVGVESPGFPGLRRVLEVLGVEVVPVPVGADGVDLAALDRALPLDLVLVTPNHQFPAGTALHAAGRQALIGWATRTGVLLVEDDYDSEYRHLGPPLPPLWSLAPDVVAHLGTFAAVLGRDVGTGYLVAPPAWQDELLEARSALGGGVAPIVQRALARYLQAGGLRRRLARARRRADTAQAEVKQRIDTLRAQPHMTGVTDTGHLLVLEMPADAAARVRDDCRRRGLILTDLADGWAGNPGLTGLLLNYGGHEPAAVRRAVDMLIDAAAGPPLLTSG
ncbi:MocR-like pyridoxine biosynthesis transcription factor PdxR [Tessaracoccus sp. G1721]